MASDSESNVAKVPEDPIRIPVDESLDTGSAYEDETRSYTTSVRSSALDFRQEHGRRYHSFREGRHFLPNDDREQERLDLHHVMIHLLMDGKLYQAPINPASRTLDLGAGTGIWTIDFADEHPAAQVRGIDLSPIQPGQLPPNLEFIVDDIEDDWGYESTPFDFVHTRYLAGSIRDWPKLVRQAFACIKPGGWIELQDWDSMPQSPDGTLTPDHQLWRWHELTVGAIAKIGMTAQPGPKLEGWVKEAGFVNVVVEKLAIPLGTWPKDPKYKRLGAYNRLQFEEAMEAITIGTLVRGISPEKAWKPEDVQALLAKVHDDLENPTLHAQYNFHIVYGQKPE